MARLFTTNDGLVVNSTPVTAPPFTMACWIRPDNTTEYMIPMILVDKDVDNHRHDMYLDHVADKLVVESVAGAAVGSTTPANTYTANAWQHVCGVWASTTSRSAYLRGGTPTTDTTSVSPAGMDRVAIGLKADLTPDASTKGRICEAGIWNVALTAPEILALALGVSPLRIRPGNLVFYAPVYGKASPEPDYTSGQRHLTVTGTTQAAHAPVMPAWGFDEPLLAGVTLGAFSLDAAPGSYALTGISAGTLAARILDATPGSYALTGIAAGLLAARLLSADPGAYVVTGTAAALLSTRLLDAAPGTYILTGTAAELLFGAAAANAFALNAVPGVYTLTGVSAATAAARIFHLSPGSYQLTGHATGLTKGQSLTLIDHTAAGLTLVDLTGASLTLVDHTPSSNLSLVDHTPDDP